MRDPFHAEWLPQLEDLLIRFVYKHYLGQNWRGESLPKDFYQSLAAHVRRLSDGFTVDRADFRTGYLRPKELRSAYLLHFHLANLVRSWGVLSEMRRRGLWQKKPVRVLDIGAASSPSLWATALFARESGSELEAAVAWDREKGILLDSKALWKEFVRLIEVRAPMLETRVADLFERNALGKIEKPYDLIWLSNILNELSPQRERQWISMVRDLVENSLTDDGVLILMEPALFRVSRRVTHFRDLLLRDLDVSIPIPCGHMGACPLNAEPRDWCHFEIQWEAPPLRRRLERTLEHRTGWLKFTYLVIQKGKRALPENQYRVISEPLDSHAGTCTLLCAPEKKVAVFFDRKRDETGRLLFESSRGDLLEAKMPPAETSPKKVRFNQYAREIDASPAMKIRKL